MAITAAQVNAFNRLNAFMDFAKTKTDENTLVHYNGRQFSVAEGDRIKGFFTWTASGRDVGANNETRNQFKSALLDLFDKQDLSQLPQEVLDVLKAGDFEKSGRPLSVRRIQAVMTAVIGTKDYTDARDDVALKNLTEKMFSTGEDVDFGKMKNNLADFANNVMIGGTKEAPGGRLGATIEKLAHGANCNGLKRVMMGCFSGIGTAISVNTDFIFVEKTGRMVKDQDGDMVAEYNNMRVPISNRGFNDALNEFVTFCKDTMALRFRSENPDRADREQILREINHEIDKLVDRIKIRHTALENVMNIPGGATRECVANFEKAVDLISKTGMRTTDQAIGLALKYAADFKALNLQAEQFEDYIRALVH